jgi:puromycin-sensitive aminopeptidase
VESYLGLALAFGNETDPDVLTALAGPLEFAARAAGRTLGPEAEAKLRARVAAAFAPALATLGWEPRAKERDDVKLRRGALLALAGGVGRDPEIEAEAEARCERYLADRAALEPNLVDAAVAIAARRGDAGRFESFLSVAKTAATPQEERRFKLALTGFHAPQLVQRTLALTLGDVVATQDVALVLARLLGNPAGAEATWRFLRKHWTKLERRLPPALVTRPIDALPQLATRQARREIAAFFAEHPVSTGPRAVRQALEQLDLVLAFDAREKQPLAEWLGA